MVFFTYIFLSFSGLKLHFQYLSPIFFFCFIYPGSSLFIHLFNIYLAPDPVPNAVDTAVGEISHSPYSFRDCTLVKTLVSHSYLYVRCFQEYASSIRNASPTCVNNIPLKTLLKYHTFHKNFLMLPVRINILF